MKKIYIIHGWGGSPEEGWLLWLNQQLKKRGFFCSNLKMPNTDEPKIKSWVNHLKKEIGRVDKNTYFVGHSIGCQTILRFLETLPQNTKIGGAVFVAPWSKLKGLDKEELQIAKPWIETPINWEKIKNFGEFISIFSDNDPVVYLDDSKTFKEKLNSKIIIEHNKSHFSGDDNVNQLKSALNSVLQLS